MLQKLKPCPFCGKEGKLREDSRESYSFFSPMYFVECVNCGCRTERVSYKWDAVQNWNNRVSDSED